MMKNGLRGWVCIVIASAGLLSGGCASLRTRAESVGKPSERDVRTVLENIMAQTGTYQVKTVTIDRVNSESSYLMGHEAYNAAFTADLEYLKDTPASAGEAAHKKGEVQHIEDGELLFTKTKKGWRGQDGEIY